MAAGFCIWSEANQGRRQELLDVRAGPPCLRYENVRMLAIVYASRAMCICATTPTFVHQEDDEMLDGVLRLDGVGLLVR